jgi:hypothetical protein
MEPMSFLEAAEASIQLRGDDEYFDGTDILDEPTRIDGPIGKVVLRPRKVRRQSVN